MSEPRSRAADPAVPAPRDALAVTMLGVSGSGKSTYILGMYAALLHGVDGCHLYSADYDEGYKIYQQLSEARQGKILDPTTERPVAHEFVLAVDDAESIAVDLTDFRGDAPFNLARDQQQSDTARLRERLAKSHAIFVTLDSEHFREPVSPSRLQAVRQATGADLFADLIGKTVAESGPRSGGRPRPSIAVLLTKVDLLEGPSAGPPRNPDQLWSEVRQVLGAAFQPHLDVRIFPVSVGSLNGAADGEEPTLTMELHDVAAPLIFAAGCFLRGRQLAVEQERDQAQANSDAARGRLLAMTDKGRFSRWRRRKRIAAAKAERAAAHERWAGLERRSNELGWRAQRVLAKLDQRDVAGSPSDGGIR
jgi:Double-GTPase 2